MLLLKVEPTMKPIEKDELFNHLGQFLKAKGIELKEGSYVQGIQKSCGLLSDAINLSAKGVEKAKTEVDKKLDQIRQCIHEKTAPKSATATTTASTTATPEAKVSAPKPRTATTGPRKPKAKARKPKASKSKS
jgi:hypothetical protein